MLQILLIRNTNRSIGSLVDRGSNITPMARDYDFYHSTFKEGGVATQSILIKWRNVKHVPDAMFRGNPTIF